MVPSSILYEEADTLWLLSSDAREEGNVELADELYGLYATKMDLAISTEWKEKENGSK